MKKRYIISIDQGTTSSRAVIFDNMCNVVATSQKEFQQIYPKPGWVEHNPMEIYASSYSVLTDAIAKSGIRPWHIDAIGIANQRETTICWNKKTGKPVYNAIVWQCRRTADYVEKLKADGLEEYIKKTTGLIPDAYFSATKIKWILDNVEGARELANEGDLLFGTVDTWLVWKFTEGKVFATDYTNASRTMLYDIHNLCWNKKLCDYFGIPMNMLPLVKNSSDDYGAVSLFGYDVPITGLAGDQQAALFGQACFNPGDIKNTYGTGCFLLMNTGDKCYESKSGLVSTIAIGIDNKITYALEGSVFVGGALIQWLRDEMHFIIDAADSEYFATKAKTSNGVVVVPAFTGLGAPYWDMYARGTILGITRGTNRNHIIRASLEAIAYQSKDLIDAMLSDTDLTISELKVDGGASRNNFLMQFQSDIISRSVKRSSIMETTALGVMFLAGLYVKTFNSTEEITNIWKADMEYTPVMDEEDITEKMTRWHKAVNACRNFEQ